MSSTGQPQAKEKSKLKSKKSKKKEESVPNSTAITAAATPSKSIVKKLSLGKIYKKKDKPEEEKDSSAKTSLEEVIVEEEKASPIVIRELDAVSSSPSERPSSSRSSTPLPSEDASHPESVKEPAVVISAEKHQTSEVPSVPPPKPPRQDHHDRSDNSDTLKTTEDQGRDEDITDKEKQLQKKLEEYNRSMAKHQVIGAAGGGGDIKRECLYKILVIGELGTGKTSIIKRYVHQFFSQHYRATIGVDFALKVINWDSNTIIRLQLWDIAGQERFGNMTRVYYKEAVGAFIVFDVTRAATFDAVLKWKQDLDNKVQLPDGGPIPCVLLANKCDQQKEGIVNNPTKMDEYCKEHKFSGWFETSAKENVNIEEAAKLLVSQILSNDLMDNGRGKGGGKDNGKFPLDSSAYVSSSNESKGCSC